MEKEFLIKEMPLFSQVSAKELAVILERSEAREYKKGELIYAEGAAPSAFYCIISGRVLVYTLGQDKQRNELEYLHRGKYFGIISLLTNEPHSVSAEAINDCLILVVQKDDFDFLLQAIPSLAVDLSRTLSRRLKRKDIHQKTIFESTVISVFSSYSQAGKTVYALNLGLSLQKETHKSVIILDLLPKDRMHTLPGKLELGQKEVFDLSADVPEGQRAFNDYIMRSKFNLDLICFHYQEEDAFCLKKLVEIISALVNDYHYIIMDLPSVMDCSIIHMLNQSDLIHILSSPDPVDLKRTNHLVGRLKDEFNFNPGKIHIIINEYKLSKIDHAEQLSVLGQDVFATMPKIDFTSVDRLVIDQPDGEYAKAIRRIARSLGDSLVGLVLGVGFGYGFCHIGVLKVIEEEKIPIDIIAGSSIGSLIACLWAMGKSSDEILKITSEFQERKHIWGLVDVTFPLLGFIKGDKLYRFLKRHLGDKTFYDLRMPLRIIASDVRKKEPKVFDKGPLVDAVMASCAMPGVFTPFKLKGQMLFDGGVINPLPTEVLLNMGVKKIIAVNVTPSREDFARQISKIKGQVSGADALGEKKLKWFDLSGRLKNIFKINIVDIIFSSVEVLQSEVARKEAELADVVLHPNTDGLFWLDLHKAQEFAKRGEIEARKNLDKIRQLVNE